MPPLETRQEREHGHARERTIDDARRPRRSPPRLGGAVPLPADGGVSDLFLVNVDELGPEDRAAAGWCVRLGVPEVIPAPVGPDFDMHELLVELTVMSGGTDPYTIEVNAFPGCTVHLVGEQVQGRVRWGVTPVTVPPAASLRWQLSRGLCQTTAVRAYSLQAPADGLVPLFASRFALFSGDADITEDLKLQFLPHSGAARVLQHYTRDDLLQCVGQFTALPPGASAWRWLEASAEPLRLVFGFGGERP